MDFTKVLTLLALLLALSYAQTLNPTPAPTESCLDQCTSWVTRNASATGNLATSTGCVSGACTFCTSVSGVCECASQDTDGLCALGGAIAAALGTAIIIVIVIASICGLCIIICIAYCICAGALCCAAASNANSGGTAQTQMA